MALITKFLTNIRGFVLQQDSERLSDYLRVEPPVPDIYFQLAQELRSGFPENSQALEKLVDRCLPEEDSVEEGKGSPWPGFNSFICEYLGYWRDVDFDNHVKLHSRLSGLLLSCANALANPTYGIMMLKTSMSLCTSLSKLVVNLSKRPELLAIIETASLGEEETKSIVESAADIIQKIFTSCLTDRSSTRFSEPKGKKVGVYIFANLTLKLLFTCRKSRLAVQMLTNLSSQGPALSLYPASQRVTFLYYLGRFYFESGHFLRAHHCFQEAYTQCPPRYLKHRRLIVRFWVPSNMLFGRFPTPALLGKPEAAGLADIFVPVCAAVRAGNFLQFRAALAARKDWLQRNGMLTCLTYRLRGLLWRCFTRRTFMLAYTPPAGGGRAAPTLDLADLVTTASYVQRRLEGYVPAGRPNPATKHAGHVNNLLLRAVSNNVSGGGGGEEGGAATTLAPPPGGPLRLRPAEGLIWGNMPVTLEAVEGVVAPLVAQELLNGFIAHTQQRFAISGTAKAGGNPVAAGWPQPYQVILKRMAEDSDGDINDVPGWVKG